VAASAVAMAAEAAGIRKRLSLLILFAGQSWCETLFGPVVGVSDGNSSPRAERITHAVWGPLHGL
jgi:hypothetical protein